jgi:hypothetical protein
VDSKRESKHSIASSVGALTIASLVVCLAGCSVSTGTVNISTTSSSSSNISTTSSSSASSTTTTAPVVPSSPIKGTEFVLGSRSNSGTVVENWSPAASAAQGAATVAGLRIETWIVGRDLEVLLLGKHPNDEITTVTNAALAAGVDGGRSRPLLTTAFRVVSGVTSEAGLPASGQDGTVATAAIGPGVNISKLGGVIAPGLAARGLDKTIVLDLGASSNRALEVIGVGRASSDAASFLQASVAAKASVATADVTIATLVVA